MNIRDEVKERDIKVAAMSIVNHVLETAGASVETRQAINDGCDEFTITTITNLISTQ